MTEEPLSQITRASDVGYRAPNTSEDVSAFRTQVVQDIGQLITRTNKHGLDIDQQSTMLNAEIQSVSQRLDQLRQIRLQEQQLADRVTYVLDLHSTAGVEYAPGSSDMSHCRINTKKGSVTLPTSSVRPVFYTVNDISGEVWPYASLSASLVNVVDPEPQTVIRADDGQLANAFTGRDRSFWVRRVTYPLTSNVSEVSAELVVRVDQGDSGGRINRLTLRPYPINTLDIMGVWIRPNDASDWQLVNELFEVVDDVPTPIESVGELEFNFQERSFVELKIGIRQRQSAVEAGNLVYSYGFEEVCGELVTYTRGGSVYRVGDLGTNNHVGWKVRAPAGRSFGKITFLNTTPSLEGESGSDRQQSNVVMYLSRSMSITAPDMIWSSFGGIVPQTGVPIDISADSFYVILIMKYVGANVLPTSLFLPGTSPEMVGLSFQAVLMSAGTLSVPEFVLPPGFWNTRNALQHRTNETAFDAMGGVLTQEQPAAFLWDDFWADNSWRAAHDRTLTLVRVDPDNMRLTNGTATANGEGVYESAEIEMSSPPFNSGWRPGKFRIHYAADVPDDAMVSFKLLYNANGNDHELDLSPAFSWVVIPSNQLVSKFSLRITMKNSSGQPAKLPSLYNYMLIFKA